MDAIVPQVLGIGELTEFVAQVGEAGTLGRHGGEQGAGLDAVSLQVLGQVGPGERRPFVDDDRDGVGADLFVGLFLDGGEPGGEAIETFQHIDQVVVPFLEDLVVDLHGADSDGRLQFVHLAGVADTVEGEADVLAPFAPETLGAVGDVVGVHDAVLAGAVAAVGAERTEDFAVLLVVGGDDAPLAGGDDVGHVGAEGGQVGQGAGRLTLVERAVGLGGVLHHEESVLFGDGVDGVHFGRFAHEVHRHDGPGTRRDGGLDLLRVDVEGLPLDVYEDRGEAGVEHGVAGGHERQGRDDHLVTSLGAEVVQYGQGQDVGVGAGADCHCLGGPDECRKAVFELTGQFAAGDALGLQAFIDQPLGGVGDGDGPERDGTFRHVQSPRSFRFKRVALMDTRCARTAGPKVFSTMSR